MNAVCSSVFTAAAALVIEAADLRGVFERSARPGLAELALGVLAFASALFRRGVLVREALLETLPLDSFSAITDP